jgi:hypothetical protein
VQSERSAEPIRVVVDETSLNFEGTPDEDAEDALDDFNDTISGFLRSGARVSKASFCYEFEARLGLSLTDFLYTRATRISPDTLRRCGDLLDRCADWDDEVEDMHSPCRIDGRDVESWSIGFAVAASGDRAMACVTCSVAGRSGSKTVTVGVMTAEVLFVCHSTQISHYWQNVLAKEHPAPDEFFRISRSAFGNIALSPDLDFRAFRGSYAVVYPWVVKVLTVLDEHLIGSFNARQGVRQDVIADIAAHGVEISPESPRTHRNARAKEQRKVKFSGNEYFCEWHAKREWNVDRIHFTTPGELPDGRILIGIFAEHLDT